MALTLSLAIKTHMIVHNIRWKVLVKWLKQKATPTPSYPLPGGHPRPSQPLQPLQQKTTSKPQRACWKGAWICDESVVKSPPLTALSCNSDKAWTRIVGMENQTDNDRQMSMMDSYLTWLLKFSYFIIDFVCFSCVCHIVCHEVSHKSIWCLSHIEIFLCGLITLFDSLHNHSRPTVWHHHHTILHHYNAIAHHSCSWLIHTFFMDRLRLYGIYPTTRTNSPLCINTLGLTSKYIKFSHTPKRDNLLARLTCKYSQL